MGRTSTAAEPWKRKAAVAVRHNDVLPFHRQFGLPVGAVLTDNGREFCGAERVLGLHFFSPPHVMKLLEIVRAETTFDATLATAFRLAGRLGKIPVEAGVCEGSSATGS